MRYSTWTTLTNAAGAGSMIWLLTPLLTDRREPWDTDGAFYPLALLIAGAAAGAIASKPLWAHYPGAFVGQLANELIFLRVGPLVIIGAVFLLVYCTIFTLAAGLAGFSRNRLMIIRGRLT
jgi:hypothetical protein